MNTKIRQLEEAIIVPVPPDIITPTTLGEGLRVLLYRAGLTQDGFAQMAELSASTVSNYLTDRYEPPASVLRRMAEVLAQSLKVDTAQLFLELGALAEVTARLNRLRGEERTVDGEEGDLSGARKTGASR